MNEYYCKNEYYCNCKEVCASFAVASQITKIITTVPGKCLDKMENAINVFSKIFGDRKKNTIL